MPHDMHGGASVKLSVYLLRESVTSFDEAIQSKHLAGENAFQELAPAATLPYECRAYIQSNKPKEPRWLPFLSTHFDTADLHLWNTSNSFVLLLRVSGRTFAVTFGYGCNALDRGKVEPRFGLMVTMNALDPAQLRTVDSNNVDLVTRQRRTHLSAGSPVCEFDLNVDLDWIRRVSGKPSSDDVAKSLGGAESVTISADCNLETLGHKCEQLLELYESDAYKENFGFIDHLQPLAKTDPLVPILNGHLRERLETGAYDRISIAYPELPDEEQLAVFKLWHGTDHIYLEDLSLSGVYRYFEICPDVPRDPSMCWIIGLDSNDSPVTHKRPLRDYLVCETEHDGQIYVLSLGQWFRVEADYAQQVRDAVAQIDDLTGTLDMLPARSGEDEGEYNARVANDKEWLLMDRRNFQVAGSYDRIEICDLMTPQKQFICVKKMRSSSTLSHLFAQGSVSARLMRESADYLCRINQMVAGLWPNVVVTPADLPTTVIVYAIPTEKAGPLSSCMFFFSLVNLLTHVQAIRRVGCRVAICKIDYESTEPQVVDRPSGSRRRSRRSERATAS